MRGLLALVVAFSIPMAAQSATKPAKKRVAVVQKAAKAKA